MKVLLYGVMTENNLGGPSLLHGVRELLTELHGPCELVAYQGTKVVGTAVSDLGFPVLRLPYRRAAALLADAALCRLGFTPRNPERALFFHHVQTADAVANLVGICFCSRFDTGRYTYLKAIKRAVGASLISLVGKMFGKRSVKCPASYGPIESETDRVAARYSAGHIFDVVCARERESERQMREVAGVLKPMMVSPDMANLMPYRPAGEGRDGLVVGISVSHQILRQWQSGEGYIDCLAHLIRHIRERHGCRVQLIPNEIHPHCSYHDGHVARDLLGAVAGVPGVGVLDVAELNSTQVKAEIGRCEVMVASRYHSCVAALSAGVPTLVVGWHNKYEELMQLYGQGEWILSSENCTTGKLIERFDALWANRGRERAVIRERYGAVREQVLAAGRRMFPG